MEFCKIVSERGKLQSKKDCLIRDKGVALNRSKGVESLYFSISS